MKNLLLLSLALVAFTLPSCGGALGAAETFAVLGASMVINSGPTEIRENLGVSPGTAVVGFPPGLMWLGRTHPGDAVAAQAHTDLTTAYNVVAALPCGSNLTGQDLGGLTLTPGVYCFEGPGQLTGTLVLDFRGQSKVRFVFQIGTTLTTANNAVVVFEHFAGCPKTCSVDWQVGGSATLGTGTKFGGNIMALDSITLARDVFLCGRALARTGAVIMNTDIVSFMSTLNPPQPSALLMDNGDTPSTGSFALLVASTEKRALRSNTALADPRTYGPIKKTPPGNTWLDHHHQPSKALIATVGQRTELC